MTDQPSPDDKSPKSQKNKHGHNMNVEGTRHILVSGDAHFHVPSPSVAKSQEASALRRAEADAQAAARQPRLDGRLINALPRRYDVTTPYYGRHAEQAIIQDLIQRGERLITIHARAGAGKTGLACKVLGDLEQNADLVTGIVSLTAGEAHRQVSLDRVLSDFGRLLPEGTLTYQPGDTAQDKVAALLRALQHGRYVLLLDNLESLLDEHDTLRDPDLQALFTVVLEQGGLTLLVTTRYKPQLDRMLRGYERPIALDSGLNDEDAVLMLRGLDKSDPPHLPAEDTKLHALVRRVDGFPRALEAAMGLLADSPTLTFDDLVQDQDLFGEEVTKYIVEMALEKLSPLYMRVMEGLALFGQPVPLVAVEYLLAPYIDWTSQKLNLRFMLDRLIERRFVSFNVATKHYFLHPLDRDYCDKRIPLGTPDDAPQLDPAVGMKLSLGKQSPVRDVPARPVPYTRYAMYARAARFYQTQRKPEKEWKTLADLEPQLSEFEYRIRLEDYDTAAELLRTFDFHYLLLWGHARLVALLHEQLHEKIVNSLLKGSHLNCLGLAYRDLGEIHKAIECYIYALSIARNIEDKSGERSYMGNLGNAYRNLGNVLMAIQCYKSALLLSRENNDKVGEESNLAGLGLVYGDLGEIKEAIDYYEQALTLAHEVGHKGNSGSLLGNLGLAYYKLGEIKEAIDYYEQALTLNRERRDRTSEGVSVGNLGHSLAESGHYAKGIVALQQALEIADEIQSPAMKNYMSAYLARAYFLQGDISTALQAIKPARQYDVPENNHNAAVLHGVIVLCANDIAFAQTAFQETLIITEAFLKQPQVAYEVRYAHALAQTGLALINNESLDTAQASYEAALAQCSARGVVQEDLRLLEELTKTPNGERLDPILFLLRDTLA